MSIFLICCWMLFGSILLLVESICVIYSLGSWPILCCWILVWFWNQRGGLPFQFFWSNLRGTGISSILSIWYNSALNYMVLNFPLFGDFFLMASWFNFSKLDLLRNLFQVFKFGIVVHNSYSTSFFTSEFLKIWMYLESS